MERMDTGWCYACGGRIGILRSVLRPLEATFESAFDGVVRAAFCSRPCHRSAPVNAATVRALGLGADASPAGLPGPSRRAPEPSRSA